MRNRRWPIGSRLIADTIVFGLEKLVTSAPWNGLVAGLVCRRPAAVAYLIAAANDSLERVVPEWAATAVTGRWSRRMQRMLAGDAKRREDFDAAKRLSSTAADGETFAAFASEYLLSAGASAFESGEFPEALRYFDESLDRWHASTLARLLEPKAGSVANYLKWATLRELGMRREALPFLFESVKTHWSPRASCREWLLLVSEAQDLADETYLRLGLEGVRRTCSPDEPELQH